MNTSAKKVYFLGLITTALFVLLCTGFYTFALLSDYSTLLGHFGQSTFTDVFLPLLYILAVVVFAVFGVVFRSSLTGREYKTSLPALFASGFAALSVGVWFFTFILSFFSGANEPLATVFGILVAITGLFALVYLILSVLPFAPRTYTVVCGTVTMLFPLCYAFLAYFDTAFALNSPIKIFDQVAMLALLFFFLAEGRMRFGAISEAVYLPIAMLATVLTGTSGISGLIYMAANGRPLIISVTHDFLMFGFFLYTLTRLISFLIPSLGMRSETEAASPTVPAFETKGAITVTPVGSTYEQESFDFDREAVSTAHAEETEDAKEATTAKEASLDTDSTEEA